MKPVLFIVGPTASGKSVVSLEIATRIGGEIVSADSMQVYRGMDIGTAKPSASEQSKVRHHLIDILPPSSSFSAFKFRELALKAICDITTRKKLPIVVGGSGLYVRALLDGFSEHPGSSPAVRKKLAEEAKRKDAGELYSKLKKCDPESSARIKPGDLRRIIRALEIHEMSGVKMSALHQKKIRIEELGYTPFVAGILKARPDLYQDIEDRVDGMFEMGWVEEVRKLKEKRLAKTAKEAIGYKDLLQALKISPHLSEDEIRKLKGLIKQKTRRFAKRQMTWFRRERGIVWFDFSAKKTPQNLATEILTCLNLI